jgi:hypothetical protein
MSSVPPEKPAEFTASDILSADAWSGRVPKPAVGLDVACIKISVDFQNVRRESVDDCLRRNLELLRESTLSDCAFAAVFAPGELVIQDIQVARGAFSQSHPEVLSGVSLETLPWLRNRLEHLRLSELRDTSAPRREQIAEARRFAELQIGSALIVAFHVQGKPAGILGLAQTLPRGPWDVNLQLLMKLIGTSLATGLERIRIEARLAKLEERNRLSQAAANDGVWDFDVENNEVTSRRGGRPCWATPTTTSAARRTGAASSIRTTSRACRRRFATTSPARARCSRARTACAIAMASGAGW